jgi:hypothetical protein
MAGGTGEPWARKRCGRCGVLGGWGSARLIDDTSLNIARVLHSRIVERHANRSVLSLTPRFQVLLVGTSQRLIAV